MQNVLEREHISTTTIFVREINRKLQNNWGISHKSQSTAVERQASKLPLQKFRHVLLRKFCRQRLKICFKVLAKMFWLIHTQIFLWVSQIIIGCFFIEHQI